MTPADFTELVKTVGAFGAMLFVMIGFVSAVLYYAKTKIDSWGEPWVKGQIEFTKSQQVNMESQAKSIEMQALSVQAIENTLKMMAVGISQILDSGKGASNEQLEELKFNFRRLEDHVLQQDVALGLKPKEKAESITDPKLKMEPMQTHGQDAKLTEKLEEIEQQTEEPNP